MASSCPYCGAALKLKFCVVCGRQSKLNKMGHLRNTARNTDATRRLEDPFSQNDSPSTNSLRFKTNMRPMMEAALGGIIAGTLIFCAAKEAYNLHATGDIDRILMPWVRTHHINFFKDWPPKPPIKHKPSDLQKKNKSAKHQNKIGKQAN